MTSTTEPVTAAHGRPVAPSHGALRPLGLDDVSIEGGFWGDRQELNATAIIEHSEHWVERMGWVANFDAAVEGRLAADRRGREFSDADVYKVMEAMAWEIGRTGNREMDARLQALVTRIAPVQEADGYLNTKFGRPGQEPRYTDLQWGHELYCYGHLLQAAIARGRTKGDDLLVETARRAADHVCDVFGPGGIESVDGHPEIETALVEFARYTGEQRYLEQARLFVERRGHGVLGDIEFGRSYFQDDVPVREASVMEGHAVRAMYLAAGAVDVAVETDDSQLLDAVIRQLATTVARRTYITGGMGAHHEGESFGSDFELPSDRAYSETCAGVGSIMLNYRLLLATGEAKYADLIERTLFNVVAASPAADGEAFFYTNTLHQREPGTVPSDDEASPRASSSLRAPWFEVSCCPPNVARTFASLDAYVATSDAQGLQLHQYAEGTVRAAIDAGTVAVRVATRYPADGLITVEVTETVGKEWTLSLRVPGWAASGAELTVAGETQAVSPGTVTVHRAFEVGDVVTLSLPVAARWTAPDPRIDALRGQLAVERGPVVLCLESTDAPTIASVNDARVVPELDDDNGHVTVGVRPLAPVDESWPFGATGATLAADAERVTLVPYYSWANRGPSTMRVWLPVAGADSVVPG
ncbi:glycoside hydrolase family 127 protein [Cryobacterium tepidiphilum]|uniref:Glycoside hydrolase family 127 protein n=1 Tax=Cryobacterium tepidiphilum TaxID=2486026 RepID=A0A3M8LFF6_9MICO|nr:beta-L-arabinofuranosidase domain-containing protein [Cryobacterium tepidiphilum]RNE64201.1 glycoside hydrolase family 127 protein [Cryobacterium tepidiphilum]